MSLCISSRVLSNKSLVTYKLHSHVHYLLHSRHNNVHHMFPLTDSYSSVVKCRFRQFVHTRFSQLWVYKEQRHFRPFFSFFCLSKKTWARIDAVFEGAKPFAFPKENQHMFGNIQKWISGLNYFRTAKTPSLAASINKMWKLLSTFFQQRKVKFNLEHAMKAQRESRGIAILFL